MDDHILISKKELLEIVHDVFLDALKKSSGFNGSSPNIMSKKRFYSRSEAALLLDKTYPTIVRYVKNGRLKAKNGKITHTSIDQFLKGV